MVSDPSLFNNIYLINFFKWAILIILVFYAIFALMIARQVSLMSKTLITPVSPIVLAVAIVHAGFAIGLIVLAWWIL